MFIGVNDIVKCFGEYRMILRPTLKKDIKGNIIFEKSYAQITVYDISQKYDLLWSKRFPINEAHAALTLFESIGYYPMPK